MHVAQGQPESVYAFHPNSHPHVVDARTPTPRNPAVLLQVYLNAFADSALSVNLKACNSFRMYNGKAAENELKASYLWGWGGGGIEGGCASRQVWGNACVWGSAKCGTAHAWSFEAMTIRAVSRI